MIEDEGIRADIPLPDFDHRTPFFGKSAFAYESEAYRCPGGAILRPSSTKGPSRRASTGPRRPPAAPARSRPSAPAAAETDPAADVTVTMFEYDFTLEGAFTTGSQVIKVANVGAQPHHMFMVRTPDPITEEQLRQILDLEVQGATPVPDSGLPDPDTFMPVAYMSTMSMGTTAWLPVNLEPGTYVLVCFVPDIESGMPHAFEGMYEVITIGDEATPTT